MYAELIESMLTGAARIALSYTGRTSGRIKDGNPVHVVTEADEAVGVYLADAIRRARPNDTIIDEERGVLAGDTRVTWVVDPIDGTSNYAVGLPLYGIAIGVLDGATPVAGGVAMPALEEVYLGERGGGAFLNGARIQVDHGAQLSTALVAYGVDGKPEAPEETRSEMARLAEIALRVRNIRISNSAFDQLMVACGKYAGSINRSSRIWDNVAAHLLITEAGGRYTTYEGAEMTYARAPERIEENFTWCAGTPGVHEQLQQLL